MTDQAQAASHWDDAYAQGDDTRSWFEEHPRMSLRMLDSAGVTAADALMDVGGGASRLAAVLLDRGFRDLTVLDISANGMRYAQHHLRGQAGQVNWLTADVLRWHPARRYRVWHDRAVFHFLTTADQRHQYLTTLNTATSPGTVVIFGCFAPDGPQHCSGLPVARYTPAQQANQVGPNWNVTGENQEAHATPAGVIQPFTWVTLRRQS
jgi:trans-aconitate methyltransferase